VRSGATDDGGAFAISEQPTRSTHEFVHLDPPLTSAVPCSPEDGDSVRDRTRHELGAACSWALSGVPQRTGVYVMNPTCLAHPVAWIEDQTTAIIDELIDSLPDPKQLTSEECRGIIARYTSVLEGNFIYWMTAALIAAKAEQSQPILLQNLYEEVHDCHPLMLRKFAIAANAFPTDKDFLAVHNDLNKVRQFMGKLSPVQSVLTMGFFEGFIQKFMAFLADLAAEQGSTEMEYTDVHGVCDIEHTEGLFKVLAAEMALMPPEPDADLFEGVTLLRTLIERIIRPQAETAAGSEEQGQVSQEHC
jgi:hypothetical protein